MIPPNSILILGTIEIMALGNEPSAGSLQTARAMGEALQLASLPTLKEGPIAETDGGTMFAEYREVVRDSCLHANENYGPSGKSLGGGARGHRGFCWAGGGAETQGRDGKNLQRAPYFY